MMKLNGTIYLTYAEVENIIFGQLSNFSTSQHVILPQNISYIDAKFVSYLKERSGDILLGLGFLYKVDEYVAVNSILNMLATFLFATNRTSSDTTFLGKTLTESQTKGYREKYGCYLLNVFVGEIEKSILKKF